MIQITPTLAIDEAEVREEFVHASGPGGQNVNKVATAVQLRFDAAGSPHLPPALVERLRALAGSRMTADGELILVVQRFRSQAQNRTAALAELVRLLRQAARPPTPRVQTRPSLGARRRRLAQKRQQGERKTRRRWRPEDDG